MAKSHSQYVCQQCGYSQVGWSGKCPNCGSWGSLVETLLESKSSRNKRSVGKSSAELIPLSKIPSVSTTRISTRIAELDRVLGGGITQGQVILLAGEPGIGKSTLLLQLADKINSTVYVSGEESAGQIAIRAQRLGIKNNQITILENTDVDQIISSIESQITHKDKVGAIIIDSIQTLSTSDMTGLAGSVGQVRECTFRLLHLAKNNGVPLFIVGHVTKEGTVAGPSTLAHMVDTVLWFEGDKTTTLRLLRAVKNRFGPTDEVGIFEMEDQGLTSISNAEKIFLSGGKKVVPGSAVSSILQGTRPLLVEIQSLVVPSKLAFPKRIAQGIDSRRLELMLAVLIRRCGLPLYEYDVFVNIAGGISVKEPSSDLALCLSIASAFFDKPLAKGLVAIGEVGLLGEIREVVAQQKRIKEAKRLGYLIPVSSNEASYVNQALKKFLR